MKNGKSDKGMRIMDLWKEMLCTAGKCDHDRR